MTTIRSGAALVTGGGTGVGRAIALALSEQRPVALLGRRPAPLRAVLAVNVVAPAVLCSLVVPGMVARGSGHVLNVTSLQGSRTFPGYGAYGASKTALMRLTDSLAGELAGSGVVVVDLSPGLVATEMTAEPGLAALLADVPDEEWTPVERVAEKATALVSGRYDVLAGRFVHAEDDLDALVASLPADDGDARRSRPAPVPGGDPLVD